MLPLMTGYCGLCLCKARSMPVHLSSQRHRRATQPKAGRRMKARATPSWMLAGRRDQLDDATPEELAAAEAWARGA